MSRGGDARLPGDPRPGDRDYGPLGGLADDVVFWLRDRERSHDLEGTRLVRRGGRGASADRRSIAERVRRILGRG